MSSTSYLPVVQQYLTRYGMTTYIILGNIGLLFNIAIFIVPAYRRNPFSLYILSASICGIIGLNFSAVPVVYALDNPNPVLTSLVFCQLQFYFRHSFNQMMRTFFILACADRYAISSNNVRTRSFSRFKIAICVTLFVPFFWLLLSILPIMLRTLDNNRCEGKKGLPAIILSVYIAIAVGVVPLLSMMIFGFLISKNLKKIRTRVQPNTSLGQAGSRVRKRDRDMMRMLLIEMICYIITTTPLAVNLIYQSATQGMIRSTQRQQIESFITYFTGTYLIYFSNSFPFYIYIIASKSFRLEFKNLLIKPYEFIIGIQLRTNVNN